MLHYCVVSVFISEYFLPSLPLGHEILAWLSQMTLLLLPSREGNCLSACISDTFVILLLPLERQPRAKSRSLPREIRRPFVVFPSETFCRSIQFSSHLVEASSKAIWVIEMKRFFRCASSGWNRNQRNPSSITCKMSSGYCLPSVKSWHSKNFKHSTWFADHSR